MKSVFPLIFLLGCVSVASAQKEGKVAGARNVTIIVDMIGVSRTDAFSLVRLDSVAMWATVSEMVKAGTATSEYLTSVTGLAGERQIVEFINEVRYPTAFEPPDGTGDWSNPKVQASRTELIQAMIVPTAFETRNQGCTLELLPQIQGKSVVVEMIPSWTMLNRFLSYPLGTEDTRLKVDQPQFQTAKVQTKVLLDSGVPQFLGSGDLDPSRDGKNADKVILVFVTATLGAER